MTLWYVLFVIVLSCSRCTHFSCSYKQAPKDQWQRNNFSTAASSFGNNGAISQLLGAQGGGVGNGNANLLTQLLGANGGGASGNTNLLSQLLGAQGRRWRCTPQLVLRLSTRTGLDCAILLLLESFAPICHLLRIMLRLPRSRCMLIFHITTLANTFVG
jgi:hypothetical protein